jgi:hypothetical protein
MKTFALVRPPRMALSAMFAVGALLLTLLGAPTPSSAATRPAAPSSPSSVLTVPGDAYAHIAYLADSKQITGLAQAIGYARGTITITGTLNYYSAFGGSRQQLWQYTNRCANSTSCEAGPVWVPTEQPGRYEMVAVANGPGGPTSDSASVTI